MPPVAQAVGLALHGAAGLHGLAVLLRGVNSLDVGHGEAVVGEQQVGVFREVRTNGFGEGPDELLSGFKMTHLQQVRLPAHRFQLVVSVFQ